VTSAAPTILALETDSAWVVILAVSLATLVAALIVRKLIARPGGLGSGILLTLPLVLPLVAAVVYEQAVLPEISVLRPARAALLERSESLLHLLMLTDRSTHTATFYALTGSVGPWLILIALGVSSFMLLRRAIGTVMVHRLIRRSRPLPDDAVELRTTVAALSFAAGLRDTPEVLLLPEGVSGAFACGATKGKVLISENLIAALDRTELEAILAHEVAHIEARDVAVVFAAGFLRDVVAWNPFAHVAFRRLVTDRELEADRRAAGLTGDPLAVASGLLKMFELVKRQRGLGQRAALAFLRPGARISRRVADLIGVADGRVSVNPVGSMPFLFAGLLVALFGLEVGERIATDEAGALAIVWGTPASSDGDVWVAPKKISKHHAATVDRSRARKTRTEQVARPIRYPELEPGLIVKEADVAKWLRAVEMRMKNAGISAATLRWEGRREWRAVPLFSGGSGGSGIGIYRINQKI